MNTNRRSVYLFIALGLITAVVVGVAVWRASTPTSPSASDIATLTPPASTVSQSGVSATTSVLETTVAEEQQPQVVATPAHDDPYLAPHAFVQPTPQAVEPTVVYRPSNIAPAPSTELAPTEESPQPGAEGSETPTPGSSEAPTTPSTPSEPGSSVEISPSSPAPTGEESPSSEPGSPAIATSEPTTSGPAASETAPPAEQVPGNGAPAPIEPAPAVQQGQVPPAASATSGDFSHNWTHWIPAPIKQFTRNFF